MTQITPKINKTLNAGVLVANSSLVFLYNIINNNKIKLNDNTTNDIIKSFFNIIKSMSKLETYYIARTLGLVNFNKINKI